MNWTAVHDWLRVEFALLPRYVWLLLVLMGILNEAIRASKWTRALSIWQGSFALVLWIPVIGSVVVAKTPFVGDLLRYAAGQAPAPWVKAARTQTDDTPTDPERPMNVRLLLPWLASATLLLSACGFCSVPANKDTARCKAQSVAVDCGAPAIMKIIIRIAPKVAAALVTFNFDSLLSDIIAELQAQGIANGMALIQCAIDHVLRAPPGGNLQAPTPVMYQNAKAFKLAHPVPR